MAQTTMTVTATVTPDGGSPFNLQDGTAYELVGNRAAPGAVAWQRLTVTSPWTAGRTVVHAVKDIQVSTLTVRVLGASLNDLETNIEAMLPNFEGHNYQVDLDFGGLAVTWSGCEPADWTIGTADGALSVPHLMSWQEQVEFTIPHQPGWT